MTVPNSKIPIEPGDIRKDDLIRREQRGDRVKAVEYIARREGDAAGNREDTYYLLHRPVVLPVELGCTIQINGTHDGVSNWTAGSKAILGEGGWFNAAGVISNDAVEELAAERGFTVWARPVGAVATEVLAEVRRSIFNSGYLHVADKGILEVNIPLKRNIAEIAAKFGVTE